MFDLTGNTALITGASGGIGAAIARTLHQQGASVVLHGTRAERLAELAAELGERAHVVTANLASREEAASLPDRAAEAAGAPVSILMNNAGITRDNLAMRMKDEEWDAVLDVNMTASMMITRACLRPMMKARFGRIISVSSIVGVIGNPGQTNYAASKAGMIGFSKALAAEVASRGITVNIVAPGFIETPMTDALDDGQREGLLGRVPMARLGPADEVAATALFLASNEASYITGATIHVNGGMVML
jgi:3-oxoacyl-[acyl-carrier protein] reductase